MIKFLSCFYFKIDGKKSKIRKIKEWIQVSLQIPWRYKIEWYYTNEWISQDSSPPASRIFYFYFFLFFPWNVTWCQGKWSSREHIWIRESKNILNPKYATICHLRKNIFFFSFSLFFKKIKIEHFGIF